MQGTIINEPIVKEIIERWKKANPFSCHNLGIHDYDGIFPSYLENVVLNRIEEINTDIISLEELSNNSNYSADKNQKFEIKLLLLALKRDKFELEVRKEYKDSPMAYVMPLAYVEGSYTIRSFASIEKRAKLIIKFENNIPNFLNESSSVLNESLPKVKLEMASHFLHGIIEYFKGAKLSDFISKSNNPSIIEEWNRVNQKAIQAMRLFLDRLKTDYLPKGHDNFKLGKEKYMEMLKHQESISIDFNILLKVGEDDLERNYQAVKKILAGKGDNYIKDMHNDYPDPDTLVEYTKSTLDRTRQFLIDADIVSVPTDDQCDVIETPEYARKFAFAAMNTPGPFEVEEAKEAYYYITPPDPNFSEEQMQQHMSLFSKPVLEVITIHEAWPGHYLQLLFNNNSNSDIAKMFARSTSMIEGWGHYVEEMIIEEGYSPFNSDDIKFGQLTEALIRNCRYVASIKMHCMDMTIEEATKLFMEKSFLSEENAIVEARRGTIDPMYLNYSLGKLLIKKLRGDMEVIQGNKFSLKEFHNTMLSNGSPPITVLRELFFEEKSLIDEIL